MRILHITPSYFPAVRYGGPIESVHALNKALVKEGAEVHVYTTNIDGKGVLDVPVGVPQDLDGVKVTYFPVTFRPWVYSRAMSEALRDIQGFDLIHITSVFLSTSFLGARAAKRAGMPYVISPRGNLMKEPLAHHGLKKLIYLSLIEQKNLAGATAIHFTAEAEKDEYRAAGLPLKRGLVIPNSIETPADILPKGKFRKKYGISSEKKMIFSMGRLVWKKGFDTLIPAFAEVAKTMPNVALVIAGEDEGGYKKNVQLLISRYQMENKVIFAGMLQGEEKSAALQDADLFVLPSYSENFGMAVAEAMSAGVPVAVTEGVALGALILEGGAGAVTPKETRVFAEAMIGILRDERKAKIMGEHGRELVAEQFSPEAVAKQWKAAYTTLIHEGRIL